MSCDRLFNDLAALIRIYGLESPGGEGGVLITNVLLTTIRDESQGDKSLRPGAGRGARCAGPPEARGCWITANEALEAISAYPLLASRVTHYLTPPVWNALIHWTNYLVATLGLSPTFRANGAANEIAIVADSSSHNAGAGKS